MIKNILALLVLLFVFTILVYEIISASSVYFTNVFQEIVTIVVILLTLKALYEALLEYINPKKVVYIYLVSFFIIVFAVIVYIICFKLNISVILYFLVSSIIVTELSINIANRLTKVDEKNSKLSYLFDLSSFVASVLLFYLTFYLYFFVIPVPKSVTNIRNPTPTHIQQFVIRKFKPEISSEEVTIYKINPLLLFLFLKLNPYKSNFADCQVFSRMFYSSFEYYGYHPKYIFFFTARLKRSVTVPFMFFGYYYSLSALGKHIKPLHVAVYMNGKVYDFEVIDYNNKTYVINPVVRNINYYKKYYNSYAICNQYMCKVYSF